MFRKITVRVVERFVHEGAVCARYQRQDNGACTDVKVKQGDAVICSADAAQDEAERRLRSGWSHRHLVR